MGGTGVAQWSRSLLAPSTVLDELPQVGDLVPLLAHLLTQLLHEGQQLRKGAGHDVCGGDRYLFHPDLEPLLLHPPYRRSLR